MSTELVREGKYDEWGNRREAAAMGDNQLAIFDQEISKRKADDFRNRLIWRDNKLVMASLLKEFKGKVDLIYFDSPFDVGADFVMDVAIV